GGYLLRDEGGGEGVWWFDGYNNNAALISAFVF
ncbi:hypothetical protein A2U01_0067461, partial [Trifolium medium]|nr:hypothetical protein [Trifolium medium]